MAAVNWKKVSGALPYKKTDDHKQKRDALWNQFDVNGNGLLSLAEVDKGIRDALRETNIFECKPVIMRAFTAAKGAVKSKSKSGDDYVERTEFRLFLLYLNQYFNYYKLFASIDVGGDHRINFDEFSAGLAKIEKYSGKIDNPKATFESIDKNGGGQILFDEFSEWAIQRALSTETDDE